MRFSHQVEDLSEEFLVGCFVNGLCDTIKYDVVSKNPSTIEEAMRLTRVEEERV